MGITLRDYQQECLDIIEAQPPGSYLVQLMTGGGKTVIFSNIPRHGRTLILAHREELVRQPAKYYDCPVGFEMAKEKSHGEEVVIASVQSLVRRLDKFSPYDFDMLITDECFPSGTLVDEKPIEEIKVGDMVTSWNHKTGREEKRKVTHIFKKPIPETMVRINEFLTCTPNHPIFSVNEGRYVDAETLAPGDCVLRRVRERNPVGYADKKSKKSVVQVQTGILLSRTHEDVCQKDFSKNNGGNQSEICVCKDESKQSYAERGMQRKNVTDTKEDWAQAGNSWWKRQGIDETTTQDDGRNIRVESIQRVCNKNQGEEDKRGASSDALQDRHCSSSVSTSDRNRRWKSFPTVETGTGQEEREVLEQCRVDSVEIFKCGSTSEHGSVQGDGYVYNLEVEGLNNYFANGILVHNCHHAASKTYRKIFDYFKPRLHLGFTATVMRGDHVRLDDIYSDIIFQRDLRWGIQNGYLTDIHCIRVDIGYDLSAVRTRMGDYAPGELEEAMEGTADAIAEAYRDYARGATLIFAVSVHQAQEIASRIPGAVVVTGETKDRASIIQRFTDGEIPCIVNVMVFTEGTDIPRVETVIIARPTQSESLYCQMTGRGLRLYPGKEKLTLIDCVGVTGKSSLCTAPSLLGINMDVVPKKYQDELQGDLFDLPTIAASMSDTPESWIRNVEIVNLWAKEQKYTTHDVNWFKMPSGDLVLSLPEKRKMIIPAPDVLGMVDLPDGSRVPMQNALDRAYKALCETQEAYRYIWDLNAVKRWSKRPASESQLQIINRMRPDFDTTDLTKGQASQILNRLFNGRRRRGA